MGHRRAVGSGHHFCVSHQGLVQGGVGLVQALGVRRDGIAPHATGVEQWPGRRMQICSTVPLVLASFLRHRVELVQNELYSSRVKEFEVYARQSNPRQDAGGDLAAGLTNPLWRLVGNFTAPKTKGGSPTSLLSLKGDVVWWEARALGAGVCTLDTTGLVSSLSLI